MNMDERRTSKVHQLLNIIGIGKPAKVPEPVKQEAVNNQWIDEKEA